LDGIGFVVVEMTRLVTSAWSCHGRASSDATRDARALHRRIHDRVDELRSSSKESSFQIIARRQACRDRPRVLVTTLPCRESRAQWATWSIPGQYRPAARARAAVPDEARDVSLRMGEVRALLMTNVADVHRRPRHVPGQDIEAEDYSMDPCDASCSPWLLSAAGGLRAPMRPST